MTEFRIIKGFYPDGSPLVYRIHGHNHPEFGDAWKGYTWIQALTGDIVGTLFMRLEDPPRGAYSPAAAPRPSPTSFSPTIDSVAQVTVAMIWHWSNTKPAKYKMCEDEVL